MRSSVRVRAMLCAAALFIGLGGPSGTLHAHAALDLAARGCRSGNPLAQVSDPARFAVLAPCVALAGVIVTVHKTADGTYQLDLRLDAASYVALGPGNLRFRHGWFLLEFRARDAAPGVRAYAVGTHVRVVGPLLLNRNHGWHEMYPVWVMKPAAQTAPPSSGGGSSGGSSGSGGGGSTGNVAPPASPASLTVVVVVTPKDMPHGYAHAVATATTQPGASCSATLDYDRAANPLAALFGLAAQTAGADGRVSWTWGVDYNISGGGHVTVTCTLAGSTATGVGYFTVD